MAQGFMPRKPIDQCRVERGLNSNVYLFMSLYSVKVSLKSRARVAIKTIYAIGDTSAGKVVGKSEGVLIGNVDQFIGRGNEILFVVYTERVKIEKNGLKTDVTRLISARLATDFERGLYYGKNY